MTIQPANTQPETTLINDNNPGCLVRGLWFLFVGLWLGGAASIVAWLLIITIIGMPFGILLLNRLPQIMTLKPIRTVTRVTTLDGRTVMVHSDVPQIHFVWRTIYFILIGWWFSLVWLILAWILAGLTFGLLLPVSFWMFDAVPAITTLARQ
jgi:uncharacterized membrane protein YccF (DUF307 family)